MQNNYELFVFFTDNPILCHDNLGEIINSMKAQEANLTGLGHCIVPTDVVPEPPVSLVVQTSNDLPQEQINADPEPIHPEIPAATTTVPPSVIITTTPAMSTTVTPELNNPSTTLLPDILLTTETSSRLIEIITMVTPQQLVQHEPVDLQSPSDQTIGPTATYSTIPELVSTIPYVDTLATEQIPSVSYVPDSAPDWTVQPLPMESPPEAINADDIKLI